MSAGGGAVRLKTTVWPGRNPVNVSPMLPVMVVNGMLVIVVVVVVVEGVVVEGVGITRITV
jgi:hypothetical protein